MTLATTPQRLNHRHEAAAQLMAAGMRRAEIAQRLGYYPGTISVFMRSREFRVRVAVLQRQIQAELRAALIERIVGNAVRRAPR